MPRRGIILVEMLAACGLIAVLLALGVQVLSATALERRHVERRAIALQEAANLMERAKSIEFVELSDARLAELAVSDDLSRILPALDVNIRVQAEPGELPSKRITVEMRWQGPGGQPESPVRITSWTFAPALPDARPAPESSVDPTDAGGAS